MLAILYIASPWRRGICHRADKEHQIACFLLFAHIIFLDCGNSPISACCSSVRFWGLDHGLQVYLVYGDHAAGIPDHVVLALETLPSQRRALLGIAAAWVLPLLPWLIKNWIVTGNPIYPVAYHLFGGVWWDEMREMQFARSFTFKEYYVDPTLIWSVYHFITTLPGVYNFQIIKEELLAGGMLFFWMLALLMPQSGCGRGLLLFWSLAGLLCWGFCLRCRAFTDSDSGDAGAVIPLRFAFGFDFSGR